MKSVQVFWRQLGGIRRFPLTLAIVWTLIIFLGTAANIWQIYRGTLESVTIQASQSFEKDLVYRRWAAEHGGLYVPISDHTPPNPYLSHIENRDVEVLGMDFTLMNPAYMTRQVLELGREQYGHEGHITSLNPLRPENAPDPWEAEALQAFEDGATEAIEVTSIDDAEYLRLMRPMVTEETCLKCHAIQGYEVGDLRGGISVSIPMEEYWGIAYDQSASTAIGYGLIWILGLSGIVIISSRLGLQITERKRAEDRAINLGTILKKSTNEIYIFDSESLVFLEVSKGARENLGYSVEELQELTPLDIKPEFTLRQFEETIAPLQTGEKVTIDLTTQHRRKDGSVYPVEVHLQLLPYRGTHAFVAIILDITKRVRAEKEKLAMEGHLRQAQKLESIGTLASGVAHEINNPLMGMINYADLIADKVKDEKLKQYSQDIMKEGNRIAAIVSNLLSFSRQDKETHSPADIRDIIDSSLSLVGSTMRKDQIAVKLDVPGDLSKIRCRSQQIQQVIINLLTNAHDALNARYPEYDENKLVRITARTFEQDGENWIRTTVEDHGVGIPEDIAKRVFDPFFTTKDRATGTGLGLSVSFGIVKEHHGELTMESVPGETTRFHMDLRVNNGWRHRANQQDDG